MIRVMVRRWRRLATLEMRVIGKTVLGWYVIVMKRLCMACGLLFIDRGARRHDTAKGHEGMTYSVPGLIQVGQL